MTTDTTLTFVVKIFKADPNIESDLEDLENQLVSSNPDKLFDYNHETDDH